MIVGAAGVSDRGVGLVIDEISRRLPQASVSCSVANGVAIASWGSVDLERSVFAGDCAYVGNLGGPAPGLGTDLCGDFALVSRSGSSLRLARGRFAGRPLYWMRIGSTAVASSRLLPLGILAGRGAVMNLHHVLGLFDPEFSLLRGPLPFIGAERVRANTLVDLDATGHLRTHSGPLRLEPELLAADP